MKKKLSVKVIMSLILSAVLFCMPIGAFMTSVLPYRQAKRKRETLSFSQAPIILQVQSVM